MQIVREKNDVALMGIKRSGEFKFKVTADVMKRMFKDIYRDPILAVIRELACNAYDAHKAANKLDTPFDIHLPTTLEPYFEIRDYGTGLSSHEIETLYSTMNESSKDQSNDFIGGLGIGSKSPLAYTDMFTVTSYYNGKQLQYIITLNEYGVPTWNFVSETKTALANGLSIQIAIKSNDADGRPDTRDINAFMEAAAKVFVYFKTLPVWTGAPCEVPRVKYVVNNDVWGLRDGKDAKGLVAIMGTVAYPIKLDAMRLDSNMLAQLEGIVFTRNHSTYSWYRDPKMTDMDINFEIGSLSITPSREELQYDSRTIANIVAQFNKIRGEFIDKTEKEVKECKTYIEACEYFYKLPESLRNGLKNSIKFNGKLLKNNIDLNIPTKTVTETYPVTQTETIPQPDGSVKTEQRTVQQVQKYEIKRFETFNLNLHTADNELRDAKKTITPRLFVRCEELRLETCNTIIFVRDCRMLNMAPKLYPYLRKTLWNGCKFFNEFYVSHSSRKEIKTNVMFIVPDTELMKDNKELRKVLKDFVKNNDLEGVKLVYLSDLTEEDNTLEPPKDASGKVVKPAKTYQFYALNVEENLMLDKKPKNVSLIDWVMSDDYHALVSAGNIKMKPEEIDVKKVKDVYYMTNSAWHGLSWHGVTLEHYFLQYYLYTKGIKKVYFVPYQRRQKHIKTHWKRLTDNIILPEEVSKLINKLAKNKTDITVGWNVFTAEYDFDADLTYLKKYAPDVYNSPEIQTFVKWEESVKEDVKKQESSRVQNLYKQFEKRNSFSAYLTNTYDVTMEKFFTDTKKYGDVKDIVKNKLSLLGYILMPAEPHSWYTRQGHPKEWATFDEKVKIWKSIVVKVFT